MKFVSLTIKRGLFHDKFDFSKAVNIIYSEKNSVGKTTLLRFLMYALGYPIPNTRDINFANYELDLEILTEDNKICHVLRDNMRINFVDEDNLSSYSLPHDLNEVHSRVFSITNIEVLNNLLGTYYIDQEKGWTLLNRGKVIGNIPFSIESLVRGLSGRSSEKMSDRLEIVKRELQKYRHMFNVAQYQAEINALGENIAYNTPIDEIEKELDILFSERKPISDELDRLKNVIRKNTSFKNYISSMQLRVKSPGGEEIPVNEDTLVDFKEDFDYLSIKRKLVADQLSEIDRKIGTFKQKQEREAVLFDVQTRIQAFDSDISKIKVDAVATERMIRRLEHEKKTLEDTITQSIKQNNALIPELHFLIVAYANELGVDERYVKPYQDFIFTNDLKSLSGTIFHKIVFSFKLSYIRLIFNHTSVRLPIVLDSPSGREIEKMNVEDMMKILGRDFVEHQVIIASINKYNFQNMNIIELRERLLSF